MLAEHSSLRSLGDSGANARFPDGLTQMVAELIGGVCETQQEADHHPRAIFLSVDQGESRTRHPLRSQWWRPSGASCPAEIGEGVSPGDREA